MNKPIPTPADEALAHKIMMVGVQCARDNTFYSGTTKECAQLIAAHVAAQAPSGLVVEAMAAILESTRYISAIQVGPMWFNSLQDARTLAKDALAAHKAQPVADVRGMVNEIAAYKTALEYAAYEIVKMQGRNPNGAEHLVEQMATSLLNQGKIATQRALASARHAMGGEGWRDIDSLDLHTNACAFRPDGTLFAGGVAYEGGGPKDKALIDTRNGKWYRPKDGKVFVVNNQSESAK